MSQAPEAPKKRVRSTKTATSSVVASSNKKAKATSQSSASKAKSTPTRARKSKGNSMTSVTPELRYRMIAEAAFFIAESHGFDPGRSLDDWLEAEAMIDARLAGSLTH